MSDEPLEQQLARLEQERSDADRRYNDALTALDQVLGSTVELPEPPAPPDLSRLVDLNQQWDTPGAPPAPTDRSLKGRLRTFIWRVVGPPLDAQRSFNSAVVDHLNRLARPQEDAHNAIARLIALLEAQAADRRRIEAHFIQYLQTITWYVDTRDRSTGAGALVLNQTLGAITDDWLKRWESLQAREARFTRQVQEVLSSIDDVRATGALAQQTALSLKRATEQLLSRNPGTAAGTGAGSGPSAPDLDAFQYIGFENAFRGSPDEIRRRLGKYLPRFEGRKRVLEIGCGRGEFLDLLRARGIGARGIDANDAMVEEARSRGLEATRADALEFLSAVDDESLDGIFAAQVVEHMPPAYLSRLIEVAAHKLEAGGVIVLETINPTCWLAFFESYIRDLSHVRPLHPDTLSFLLRAGGFGRVSVEYSAPVPTEQRLEDFALLAGATEDPIIEDLIGRLNENVQKLNTRLFGFQDYAVIGER